MDYHARCTFGNEPATLLCRRCGRPYCQDHGSSFCAVCLDPVTVAPSSLVYRGALGVLIVGLVLGSYLLFLAPRTASSRSVSAGAATRHTGVAKVGTTLASPVTPVPVATTPYPANTPDPGPHDYTIKAGDTLDAIAAYYGVRPETIRQLNPTVNPTNLQVGQVIHIPATR